MLYVVAIVTGIVTLAVMMRKRARMGYLEEMRGVYGPNPFDVDDVLAVARKAVQLANPTLSEQECDRLAREAAITVLDVYE